MARQAATRKIIEVEDGEEFTVPAFSGGEPPAPPIASAEPIINSPSLALMMFLAAETMFFAGLIGAFIVFRISNETWPPLFQPRLPVAVTAVNTFILLLSGVTMRWAVRSIRAGRLSSLVRYLSVTAVLGTLFLAVQGYEWVRLIHFGLTLSSGVYGGTFYTLIGCHGLHVLGALIWLIAVLVLARRGRFTAARNTGVVLFGMYWTFVVALWPVLYGLVYLY